MSHAVYKMLVGGGADKLFWRLDAHRLRILCYHGICSETVKGKDWAPDCFVTAPAFESQMQYLSANARVLSLSEGVRRLHDGTLPRRAVCITFDDGYANNLAVAYPVLARYGIPATIFISSAYVDSGDFFPFIKLKLIQLSLGTDAARQALSDYKSAPLDTVMERAAQWWDKVEADVTEIQRKTLRPLTIAEAGAFDAQLIEIGGHGHTHCILGNESESRRRQEIVTCIATISQWTGRPVRLFAYPNGQHGDFGSSDQEILRERGIDSAVTGIAGANGKGADPLSLRRYPVGIFHDQDGFRAELSGVRTAIMRMT